MSTNYTSKTFFMTFWRQNLVNMGIDTETWDKVDGGDDTLAAEVSASVYDAITDIGGSHYGTLCRSADGKLHIHDVVTFDSAKRRNSVAKSFGSSHTEDMKGTKSQAAAYINKEGKFEEKGEVILSSFGNINSISDNSGRRTDLLSFDKLVMSGELTSLSRYLYDHPEIESSKNVKVYEGRYHNLLWAKSQAYRNVEVVYVEGRSKNGKTLGVYEQFDPDSVFRISGDSKQAFPFDGYEGQPILWLDELRPGLFDQSFLFQILQGYPLRLNIKGGHSFACWTKVYITTSFPLNSWFACESHEYDNYREQFFNRITRHAFAFRYAWWEVPVSIPLENMPGFRAPRFASTLDSLEGVLAMRIEDAFKAGKCLWFTKNPALVNDLFNAYGNRLSFDVSASENVEDDETE